MANTQHIKLAQVTSDKTSDSSSPFEIEFYMLQGIGFCCMGYCDPQGKWRSAFNHVELFGKIRILG